MRRHLTEVCWKEDTAIKETIGAPDRHSHVEKQGREVNWIIEMDVRAVHFHLVPKLPT